MIQIPRCVPSVTRVQPPSEGSDAPHPSSSGHVLLRAVAADHARRRRVADSERGHGAGGASSAVLA